LANTQTNKNRDGLAKENMETKVNLSESSDTLNPELTELTQSPKVAV
jgi:hypothetical protein